MSRSAPVKLDLIASISNFGDLLRYLRQRAQLTQRDLALAVGYSISQISRLEHNERLPDEMTLLAVFVPALCLEQEPETVERLFALAHRTRGTTTISPAQPETNDTAPCDNPALPQPVPRLSNLPNRLTSFIGRDQDVVTLQRLVKDHRLVTLSGVGGVGKSSLALAVANTLTFSDGVWLLELAPITEAGLVARLLAELFTLPEFPGRTPLEAVIAYLQDKELLLIVDNCEHLISTCADLVDRLLQASATLHILATSREVLNTAGEREWPVLPLPTPTLIENDLVAPTLAQLQTFASAQLFIERAQAVKADLIFTDHESPLIAHICQQVDGIPLALELAAARCKSFALPEIVARLQDRFALLSAGRRTALLRHQTLRATIDWSYDLLSLAEAALLRALSIFVGGWTLEAAEYMADHCQGCSPAFDLLHQLGNKSLIVVDQQGATSRYRMLETIREYALGQLASLDEQKCVQHCHAAYYCSLTMRAEAEMRGPKLKYWLDRLEIEFQNIHAALTWALKVGAASTGLEICGALRQYWDCRGRVLEAQGWLQKFLSISSHIPLAVQAKARLTIGVMELILGNTDTAEIFFQQSLALYQQSAEPLGVASAYMELGNVSTFQSNYEQALIFFQKSLDLYQDLNDTWGIAVVHTYLGGLAVEQGNYVESQTFLETGLKLLYELGDRFWITNALDTLVYIAKQQNDHQKAAVYIVEVLAERRALEDKIGIAYALNNLGRHILYTGDLTQAKLYLDESFALAQELGIPRLLSFAHANQGNMAFEQGEYERSTKFYLQSLEETYHNNEPIYIAILFERLAAVHMVQKRAEKAVTLLSLAEKLRKTIGIPLPTLDQPRHNQMMKTVSAQLDEAAFTNAWAQGESLTVDEAIAYVLGKPLSE